VRSIYGFDGPEELEGAGGVDGGDTRAGAEAGDDARPALLDDDALPALPLRMPPYDPLLGLPALRALPDERSAPELRP
jgi:hypothetical protein